MGGDKFLNNRTHLWDDVLLENLEEFAEGSFGLRTLVRRLLGHLHSG